MSKDYWVVGERTYEAGSIFAGTRFIESYANRSEFEKAFFRDCYENGNGPWVHSFVIKEGLNRDDAEKFLNQK